MPRKIVIQDAINGPKFWRVECLDSVTGEALSCGNSEQSREHAIEIAKAFLEMNPFGCGDSSFEYFDLSPVDGQEVA